MNRMKTLTFVGLKIFLKKTTTKNGMWAIYILECFVIKKFLKKKKYDDFLKIIRNAYYGNMC